MGDGAHITFHNGNVLWYNRKEILKFIDIHRADNIISEPMKTLERLLSVKVPLAGARALGIIKCCITGPFQHAFDKTCENIYDIVPYTVQTRAALQEYSVDAADLFEQPKSVLLFEETGDAEIDALTIMAMQLILRNVLIKFEKYCKQYLPGGEFENATEQDREDMRNCPLTNRACESVMATLDHYIKRKPNATPGFLESMIMLKSSDLSELDERSHEEKKSSGQLQKGMLMKILKKIRLIKGDAHHVRRHF